MLEPNSSKRHKANALREKWWHKRHHIRTNFPHLIKQLEIWYSSKSPQKALKSRLMHWFDAFFRTRNRNSGFGLQGKSTSALRPLPSHSGNRRAHLKAVTYSDLRQWQSCCRNRQALPAIQPIFLLRCSRRSGISRRHRIHSVSGA